MSEFQIIASVSRIDGLRVAARTSSFALRDRELDVRAIGDTLGVSAVLEGTVRKDGNLLRVTAQLIDAGSGYHTCGCRAEAGRTPRPCPYTPPRRSYRK